MSDLPEGWVEKNLVSCLDKVIDYRGKTPKKSDSGILTLSAKSVKMGKIDYSKAYHISKETYDKFMVRGFPKKKDILMTTEAPLGCIAKLDRGDVSVAQRLLTLRGKEGILDNNYLMFYPTSRRGQHELQSRASGSTVQGIKRSEFEYVQIVLPPFPEQKAIADMLSSFDEKIEMLREQNKTLETLAQTIFKEWFVHFNYPKSPPGDLGAMVDSKLGKIPKGWRVGTLRDVVDIFNSKRIPLSSNERQKRQGIYPYYGATKAMDYIDDYLFDGTYLLMAEDGSVMDDNGYPFLQYVWDKFWVNNHTHVLQGKNGFSTAALYVFLRRRNVAGIVNGAVQLKINQTNLMNFEMLLPAEDVMQKFNGLLQPTFEKVKNNSTQIQELSKARDTLLLKLMSGKVRVGHG